MGERVWPCVRGFGQALTGGTLALAALGLAGGVAHAAPTAHWCPGTVWDPSWGTVYNWDWGKCHDWQGPAGQSFPTGAGPWGPAPIWAPPPPPPPSWAPGAKLMWNPTGPGNWGFWNNGIWTPV